MISIRETDGLRVGEITTNLCTRRLLHFRRVRSTNVTACRLAENGIDAVVVADSQQCGYGRLGRKWDSSPNGGLYMSLTLKHKIQAALVPSISIAAALAVHRVLYPLVEGVRIKWPNDVHVCGKKICGIISESVAGCDDAVVVGCGINVNQDSNAFAPEVKSLATSLFIECRKTFDIKEIMINIVRNFDDLCIELEQTGFSNILREYKQNCSTLFKPTVIKDGEKVLCRGVAVDISNEGAVCIRKRDGSLEQFNYGEVSSREII